MPGGAKPEKPCKQKNHCIFEHLPCKAMLYSFVSESCARERTPVLSNMLLTVSFTVEMDTKSRAAICLFVRPWHISSATSRSRGESLGLPPPILAADRSNSAPSREISPYADSGRSFSRIGLISE